MSRLPRPAHVVACVAVVASALAACSSGSDTGGSTSTTARGKSIIYVAPNQVGSYVAVSCGAKEVAKQQGMKFTVQYAQGFTASNQIPMVNAAVAAKPDVLMVSAADTKALVVPLKQAAAQGIKVITVANGIADPSFLTSAVSGANGANGARAADLLGNLAKGRTGDVAYIGFTPGGSAITDARQQGFTDEIKKYPNLHLLSPTILSSVDATAGAAAANAILSAHPDLLGIVGSFVPMSNGMAQAIKERGLDGKVIALQMDSDPQGVSDVRSGSLSALVGETFRDEGAAAVKQAANAVTGKPVTKDVTTQPVEFTPGNATDPAMQKYITKETC